MRTAQHPTLGILVREDGCVYLPKSGKNPAHWTYGYKHSQGYLCVAVMGKQIYVHRLVADTFIPNPENKTFIDHIDRNPTHNNVENLRWVTRSENNRNRSANDRVDARGGTHKYEDEKQFYKEKSARRSKTHKYVRFSDGKSRWLPIPEAEELLKLTVKERIWKQCRF